MCVISNPTFPPFRKSVSVQLFPALFIEQNNVENSVLFGLVEVTIFFSSYLPGTVLKVCEGVWWLWVGGGGGWLES
jgi:hypothetical protein